MQKDKSIIFNSPNVDQCTQNILSPHRLNKEHSRKVSSGYFLVCWTTHMSCGGGHLQSLIETKRGNIL